MRASRPKRVGLPPLVDANVTSFLVPMRVHTVYPVGFVAVVTLQVDPAQVKEHR